jgi:hypothetical protein
MKEDIREEYCLLKEKLEEINWSLEGKCDDIDCNKYAYKYLLKKGYKPTLDHKFSCIDKLKRDKNAIMRILSQKKYRKNRYIKCPVCKKDVDELDDKSTIVSFTKKVEGKPYYQWNGLWAHDKCKNKVKIPDGWKR